MKYYIIAGEASGDLHGSNLIKALRQKDKAAAFRVWGGDLMEAAGATLIKHYKDLAFMGFLEVVLNLRTVLKNLKFCKSLHHPAAWNVQGPGQWGTHGTRPACHEACPTT